MTTKTSIAEVVSRISHKPMLMAPHFMGLGTAVREYASADRTLEEAAEEHRKNQTLASFGFSRQDNISKPYAFSNGVAFIPVQGTLINRFGSSWGFITGYNYIRAMIAAAMDDDDVTLIVLDINSYGGEAAGCFELSDYIYSQRDIKPILGVIDSNCYSAAYSIGSACTSLVSTPSGGSGSIGVVVMHANYGKMLDEIGIEVTFIFSGDHKVDGNPYEALSPDVTASIQTAVDRTRGVFAATVARNRGLSVDAVIATQAKCFDSEEAMSLGLIDAILPPSEAVGAYLDELSGSPDENEEQAMATKTESELAAEQAASATQLAEATATAAASARTAERERINGIQSCDEAKNKSKLASHLALNTEMSVADAKTILGAAAPEQAAVVAAPGKEASTEPNAFQQAMDKGQHPNVGADGSGEADKRAEGGAKRSSGILAAHTAATGMKH